MAYINLVPSELTVGVGETKTVTIDTDGSWPYYTVIWDDAQEIAALDPFLPDGDTIETTTIEVTGVSVGTTWFEITIDEGQSARCNITVTAESTGGDSGITIVENFTPSSAGWYYNITDMDWNTQKLKLVFDTSDVSGDDLPIIDMGRDVVHADDTILSLFIDTNKRLNCLALSSPVFSGALGVWTMYISKDGLYTTNGTTENTVSARSIMNDLTALTDFQIGTCEAEDIDTIKNISIYIVGLDDSGGGSSGGSSGGSGTTESRSTKLIPTSGSGSSWSNIANAYDNNTSTSATVSTTSSNYSSRTATFNFDTSSIPSNATITNATLNVSVKGGSTRLTLYADINKNSSNRVIEEVLSTSQAEYTADISNYINNLSSVMITSHNSRSTSYTTTLYEIWIDVEYTVPVGTATRNLYIGSLAIQELCLGSIKISEAYLGSILLYSGTSSGGDSGSGDSGGGSSDISSITWPAGTGTIRSSFAPNGAEWVDTINMNTSGGRWTQALVVDIDLRNCEEGVQEHILSIGTNISSEESDECFHIYFYRSDSESGELYTTYNADEASDISFCTVSDDFVRLAFDYSNGYQIGYVSDGYEGLSLISDLASPADCYATHTPVYVGLALGNNNSHAIYTIHVENI